MRKLYGLFLAAALCAGCSGASPTVPNANSAPNVNQPKNVNQPVSEESNKANSNSAGLPNNAPSKLYAQMSDAEKDKFIAEQADTVLDKFGRTDGDHISPQGLALIKTYINSYAARMAPKAPAKCSIGDDLLTLLNRGAKYSKPISDAFTSQGQPAQLGIYTAMIESEFCPAIQSPTGLLGMFQLTFADASQFRFKSRQRSLRSQFG